ncbi:MAG: hypothetical protein ACM3X4_00335 [Ignavibacteriales bacterium]
MPFIAQTPGVFTQAGVSVLKPNQYGVYGLFKQGVWVYVGKGDIRQRLLDHLNGDNPCITKNAPTHYVAEVTRNADTREKELIVELQPVCNLRIG